MRCPRRGTNSNQSNNLVDRWRENNTCSHCGSVSPEEFFRRVEAGDQVVPTDKNYKAYLRNPHGKVYFQHFSAEDQSTFIMLLNSKKMEIGIPGHFYTTPFFIKYKTVEDKLSDDHKPD